MIFKEQYNKLLSEKKQTLSTLSEESVCLLTQLANPDKWFEAMAVCEAAVDAGKLDDNILNLRKKMFSFGNELHSSVKLSDEDYAEWFTQLVEFNKKLADAGVAEAWVELCSLYENARFPHRDLAKSEEYAFKGVSLDIPLALALVGYHLYYGIGFATLDKEKGRELILRAKEKNFEKADMYILLMENDLDIDLATYIQKVKDYNSAAQPDSHIWHFLGDIYYEKFKDPEKAVEAYNKGIEASNDPYCNYRKAFAILNEDTAGAKDEALHMLEYAYEWNVIDAAEALGQYYCLNEEDIDMEKAVEWLKKAISYYNSHAMLDLACIYLYNDEYKDIEMGREYIDLAVESGNIKALSEKAFFLLETDEDNTNIPLAKELLEKACEAGDGYAAYRLGCGYQNAEFSETRDYETAFNYYLLGAERNYLYAVELLGFYYKKGLGVKVDPQKAVEYYRKAVERGSNYAQIELSLCYEEGFGVEQDLNTAFELLKLAAASNNQHAHNKLGYYYLNGAVDEPDFDKAFEHFSKAAEAGNFDAMYNMGRMYKYAIGRPANPGLAVEYFEKAAEGGDVDANIEMGVSHEYEYGGLEFDAEKIMKYMTSAAERGHSFAQYKLGLYYYHGLGGTDIAKSLEYLKKACENGSIHAAAALGEHFLYACSDENGDSKNEAFKYYKHAAEKDYISEGIGLCYQYGIGVERSESEAFKYFLIAAGRDCIAAKYRLGICYKYEVGTTKNLAEAYKWLLQAAEEGSRAAEYEIAMMLLDGEGVAMNPEKGLEWLHKSAEDEYDEAQFELGNCYLIGRGVEENEIQAVYWYQKAAENGNEKAQKIIGKHSNKRR
jgi:TPR repeat protein